MQKLKIKIEDRFVEPLLRNKGYLLEVKDKDELAVRFRHIARIARIRSLRVKAYLNKIKSCETLSQSLLFIAKLFIEAQSKKFKNLAATKNRIYSKAIV